MLSIVTAVVTLTILNIEPVIGHCKLVRTAATLPPDGVNDQPISWGLGVNKENKFPWFMSQGLDAGPDAPIFGKQIQWYENPEHPCGETEEWGPLDIPAWLTQSEASGVATIGSDGKFETQIFQVNRDGGGGCTCEYDTDANATSWNKCETLVNPPGQDGMLPVDRVNHTAVFQLPAKTVCTGGIFGDKCLVRIRCGWKLRFGGCVAIRTADSPAPKALKIVGVDGEEPSADTPANGTITDSIIQTLAQQVLDSMKAQKIIVSAQKTCRNKQNGDTLVKRSRTHMKRDLGLSIQIDENLQVISEKVLDLMKLQNMRLSSNS